jgi:tRNA C32,U32 (ribose-2'-O)-methylase TrmJ
VIPLVGFSQSLNVSVAAGITIHHVRQWKENRKEKAEALPENENRQLMERWIKKTVKHADRILDVLNENDE